jgi:hypothetical protein
LKSFVSKPSIAALIREILTVQLVFTIIKVFIIVV